MGKLSVPGVPGLSRVPRVRSGLPANVNEDAIRSLIAGGRDPAVVRMEEERQFLDNFFGRPKEIGEPDLSGIELPPSISEMQAATGIPRRLFEYAQWANALEGQQPEIPLADWLRDNDRTRALVRGRIERLTPEQQASSIPAVGLQAERDARDAFRVRRDDRASRMADADAGAIAGLGGAGAILGALGLGGDVTPVDIGERAAEATYADDAIPDLTAEDPMVGGIDDYLLDARQDDLISLTPDDELMILPDTPEQAVELSPGPEAPMSQMPNLSPPEKRSVDALMSKGDAYQRAVDIITGKASMSPEEYRAVTGGRR